MSSREAQPRDSSVFGKAGYRREAGNILRLAWPLMIAQGGYMLMGVVDTAVVGHVGSLDMAAVGLGNGLVGVILAVGIGISLGVEPLIGQAHGAKDPRRARAWLWQAGWLVALLSVPLVLLTIGAMWLLEPAGIDSTIAARTTDYMWSRIPSVPFQCLAIVTRAYLSNVGRPRPALWASVLANIANLGLDLVLVLGWGGVPALGAVGVGWATTVCMALVSVVHMYAIASIWRRGEDHHGAPVTDVPRRLVPAEVRNIFVLGWPIGLQFGVEVGIFAAVATLIGRGGDVDLAAHQIALSLASYTFMNAVGIASATTARVGFHIGAGSPADARAAGLLGIGLGGAFMLLTGAVFLFAAEPLAGLFASEPPVQELGASLLRVAGVFAVVDGVQVVSAGALRGAADTKMAFYVNLGAHWVIGLPVGLLLHSRIGPAGYWWGLTAGLTLVAVVLGVRFLRLPKDALKKRAEA